MKAIIIEEKEFSEFRELFTAKASELKERPPHEMVDNALWTSAVNESVRLFNYWFCTWAERQGAKSF